MSCLSLAVIIITHSLKFNNFRDLIIQLQRREQCNLQRWEGCIMLMQHSIVFFFNGADCSLTKTRVWNSKIDEDSGAPYCMHFGNQLASLVLRLSRSHAERRVESLGTRLPTCKLQ